MIFDIISYKLEEDRRRNALEYDIKEQKMIEEFFKRKGLDNNEDWKKIAEIKEDYKPESWTPKNKKKKELENDE